MGCSAGTGGAAGIAARVGVTLAGALDLGTSVFSAMLDMVIGGAACVGSSGKASDGGGGIGRLPSRCGRRTASGWNVGGTGGCTTGVDKVTVGGSTASGTGCSSGGRRQSCV